MAKLRPLGQVTDDLETLLCEMAINHELQMGEVLALVKCYLDVHIPGCAETYSDGSSPEFYYGPKRQQ